MRQVELCHTDTMMSTTRPCQPKNHQCMQCKRWYTAKGIGNHVQNCMKWDDAPPSPCLSELGNASDDGMLMEELSLSSGSTCSQSDSQPGGLLEPPSPFPAFDDLGMGFNHTPNQDDESADLYQHEHVYDSKEDDDWWHELCVQETEHELLVALEGEEMEDFEDLLNWIDNKFNLEVFQNGGWCTCCSPSLQLISLLGSSLLTVEDKQNIRMFTLKYCHNITNLLHTDLCEQFQNELSILTGFTLQKRILKLTGWNPVCHDCCINSCIAYTGLLQRLEFCPHCKTPQQDEHGKTAPYFTLPLSPQIASLYSASGNTHEAMKYNVEMLESFDPSKVRDIHNSTAVRSLLGKRVVVNGVEHQHTYFEDR